MKSNALHFTALNCIALHCTELYCTALHSTALHCTALHCPALHCTALHCTALHCTALHCTALHCTLGENLCKVLRCFVEEVINVVSQFCAFWCHFLAHFGTSCYFFKIFFALFGLLVFYAVLSKIRFVIIYALFRVKLFWLKPCRCKKEFSFSISDLSPRTARWPLHTDHSWNTKALKISNLWHGFKISPILTDLSHIFTIYELQQILKLQYGITLYETYRLRKKSRFLL